MTKFFISYRREDSSGYAGRLFDRLQAQLGNNQVFMDIDTIKPGMDFVEAINQAVGKCNVLIAVIGPGGSPAPTLVDVAGWTIEKTLSA